jgi:hypothetical protein
MGAENAAENAAATTSCAAGRRTSAACRLHGLPAMTQWPATSLAECGATSVTYGYDESAAQLQIRVRQGAAPGEQAGAGRAVTRSSKK